MARERIRHESLCGQGKRLPKSYRKWRRDKLVKTDSNSPEYRSYLLRHQEMLKRLKQGRS